MVHPSAAESSGSRDDREGLGDLVDGIAADVGLSGVIRIDVEGSLAVQRAYGLAHRGLGVPNTVDTQFATASGTKGLTALTVMSLVERGELGLDTTARSVLGGDLPLIDDRVTVEQLLAHRSGIGDYLDEDEVGRQQRLRPDRAGPRAGDHRAVPRRVGRLPDEVRAR